MRWRDAIGLASRGVRRRPGRAVLTVLAVALAAALLTALLTISGTAENRVLDELAKGGPLAGITVAAAAPDPQEVGLDNAQPGEGRLLGDDALARIADLPQVRQVLPVVTARMFVSEPSETVDGDPFQPFVETAVGVDMAEISSLPVSLLAGRFPTPASGTEVAVTQGYLERIGLDRTTAGEVLGTEVSMAAGRVFDQESIVGRWVRAEVVGVVAQEAAAGSFLLPIEQTSIARRYTQSGPDRGERFDLDPSPYTGLFVVAEGIDNVSRVRQQITAIGYATQAPENLIASVRRYLRVVEIVLTAVGGIALVIAALGITNALLAAVRERRREIGVLKAIGGRDRDVLRIFLVEAAVLGLLGGLLGTAAGWAIARGVGQVVNGYLTEQGLVGVRLTLPVVVIIGGIIGSTLLAVLGGAFPALRAARLPAREAVGGS